MIFLLSSRLSSIYVSISSVENAGLSHSLSHSSSSNASSNDLGSSFIPNDRLLSLLILYTFSSIGLPGSIFFLTPSSPARIIAAEARYGLELGSGGLYSILIVLLSKLLYAGILIAALLFAFPHTRYRCFITWYQPFIAVYRRTYYS